MDAMKSVYPSLGKLANMKTYCLDIMGLLPEVCLAPSWVIADWISRQQKSLLDKY